MSHSDTGTVIDCTTAAITMGPNGGLELLLPEPKGGIVPDMHIALTATFIRLDQEPDFAAEQIEWFKDQAKS